MQLQDLLIDNAREKSAVSFLIFRRQLPSPEHCWGSGGSGEPIEALGSSKTAFLAPGSVNCPATARAYSARSSHSQASFRIDGIFDPPSISLPAVRSFILGM
jgi:hypothetical protein